MKKRISLLMAGLLSLGLLVNTSAFAESNASSNASNAAGASGEIVKLGIGHATSVAKSKEFTAEKGGVAQSDVIIAVVGLDKDGKIASVSIDNAQSKVEYNPDGTLKTNVKEEIKTKRDLGADYGMIKASTIKKEWFEQMDAFEKWLVGKTADQIKNMKVKEKDSSHPAVPDEADLVSSITISVEGYQAAVLKAMETAIELKEPADKVGLGVIVKASKSKEKMEEKGAAASIDTYTTAMALKGDKIVNGILDTVQVKVEFELDGKIKTDLKAEIKSKLELGDKYGMKAASKIQKEWNEQSKALTDWIAGKTIEEVKAMKVEEKDGKVKTSEADLVSSVTVDVATYLKIFEEAYKMAK